jgi:membrane protease YdiL (CAAX protease family)
VKWLGLMAIFIAVTDLMSFFLDRPIVPVFMKTVYASANPVWLIWVALVIAAPIFEEAFFRGFLFQGFSSSFMGPFGAIALTAGLWALIHTQYDLYGIGTIFCLGLLIGLARLHTGSLWPPIAMHAMANFVSTVETALLS